MYISEIKIQGFRNFKNSDVSFNDGINVIIGHNNAGKTNLLKALSLVIDTQCPKRLDVDDFNKNVKLEELKNAPPTVSISITISQSEDEELESDDLVTVSNWLTKIKPPYQAQLTYLFFLPEKEREKYISSISNADDNSSAWRIIKQDFIRLYTHRIFCGNPSYQVIADSDSLQKFDFQFLNAIRDVERDMFTGKNSLLREVLEFFIDYDIKSKPASEQPQEEKNSAIKIKRDEFSIKSRALISELQNRMESGKGQILTYANQTGATFNKSTPDFEGDLSEADLLATLKLVVEQESGIKIPATHNGLGYNNLIFMSLLLAKMQVITDIDYLGGNAKVFPILAIEEPEAHLHPAMQYKFLKFLRENKDSHKKVRQIFVTTHSTHITSAVSLEEIICLHTLDNQVKVGYPGRVFPNTEDGNKSKAYVQRFLDATRSDMLFAQKVIFVEGLAEQLLLSVLAKYCGQSIEDNHIAIINIGGRYFHHFLHLFDSSKDYTINKKVCCITDRDPERTKNQKGSKSSYCYPFEYNQDMSEYTYKDHSSELLSTYKSHNNIRFFSPDEKFGKTFEYDLMLSNCNSEILLTESMSNDAEIKKLIAMHNRNAGIQELTRELYKSDENQRIIESINANNSFDENEKRASIIAARYLNSVGKGENALAGC